MSIYIAHSFYVIYSDEQYPYGTLLQHIKVFYVIYSLFLLFSLFCSRLLLLELCSETQTILLSPAGLNFSHYYKKKKTCNYICILYDS